MISPLRLVRRVVPASIAGSQNDVGLERGQFHRLFSDIVGISPTPGIVTLRNSGRSETVHSARLKPRR